MGDKLRYAVAENKMAFWQNERGEEFAGMEIQFDREITLQEQMTVYRALGELFKASEPDASAAISLFDFRSRSSLWLIMRVLPTYVSDENRPIVAALAFIRARLPVTQLRPIPEESED